MLHSFVQKNDWSWSDLELAALFIDSINRSHLKCQITIKVISNQWLNIELYLGIQCKSTIVDIVYSQTVPI